MRTFIKQILVRYKYIVYNRRKKQILDRIKNQKQITIIFFILYESMWKSDELLRKLLNDPRFKVYIISSPYPEHPLKFSKENQEKVELYFKTKGFPFIRGRNFESGEWFDVQSLNPDIIFYQQPYNSGFKGTRIEKFWKKCLFGYISYCFDIEIDPTGAFYNNLLQNISWRVFLATESERIQESRVLFSHGKNIVVTGSPVGDKIISSVNNNTFKWKQDSLDIKRVIWAPHHSILKTDSLNYSNFLDIAEEMIRICKEFEGQVQFVFKPHPVLKRKLYKLDDWGVAKTDKYYETWNTMPNSLVQDGEYCTLFASSDAMIHDSASFTAEYLYTGKPVMYLTKEGHEEFLSEFGKQCFYQHYLGYDANDIRKFIKEIVITGNDLKKKDRELFIKENLLTSNGKSACTNMYEEFSKLKS